LALQSDTWFTTFHAAILEIWPKQYFCTLCPV
jgi:hypothetical protein